VERLDDIGRNVTTVTSITMEVLRRVAPTVTTVSMVVMSAAPMRTVNVRVESEVVATTVQVPIVTSAIRPRTAMAMRLFAVVLPAISVLVVALVC